jgi:UDP-N-acetylglucosamine--N-acetylmuramyl-(pentapeptide) pyrophosphoryl-undecaprenol N-acetylglucosamine transferase
MPETCGILAVCAGGTGGHVIPALAVYEALTDLGFAGKVYWLHTLRGEEKALSDYPEIERIPLALDSPRHPFSFVLSLAQSLWKTFDLFRRARPFAVVATGGYTALPGVLAAWLLRVPVLLIEVNIQPGRATRLLSRLARQTYVPADTSLRGTVKVVGIPLRRVIRTLTKQTARIALGLSDSDFLITVTGGSQGAHAINHAFESALPDISKAVGPSLVVFHQTGEADESSLLKSYKEMGVRAEVKAFFPDLPHRLAAADLVVSRAGANTLAEIIGVATPAIVIPYPHAGKHQRENARYYAEAGAVVLVEQQQGWENHLKNEMLRLVTHPEARLQISANCARWNFGSAATIIAQDLLALHAGQG